MKKEHLDTSIIRQLESQGNISDDWNSVTYSGFMNWKKVRNNSFFGSVFLEGVKDSGDISVTGRVSGIASCRIENSIIGSRSSLFNIGLIKEVEIGRNCRLENIGEIIGTEGYSQPTECSLGNESGGRTCFLFPGMKPWLATLMISYPHYKDLLANCKNIAIQSNKAYRRNQIGNSVEIKGVKVINNCYIGSFCRIESSDIIRNVVFMDQNDISLISEGSLLLEDGIIEMNSFVGSGVIARRFYLGEASVLDEGARISEAFISENSHIAGCEIQHSIMLPFHEQHHSNSFLIAARLEGQSNIAAGAVIGSNHNSRRNDCELLAERGFWPALNVSLKHNSRFSAFNVLVKGDYPQEIYNPYPFSLVANDESRQALLIFPGYWFINNPYALFRNSFKFKERDKRTRPVLPAAEEFMSPDTANEVVGAYIRLEQLVLMNGEYYDNSLERGRRPVIIIKVEESMEAYLDMLLYYSVSFLLDSEFDFSKLPISLKKNELNSWKNLGGILFSEDSVSSLISQIAENQNTGLNGFDNIMEVLYTRDLILREQQAASCLRFWIEKKKTMKLSKEQILKVYLDLLERIEISIVENRRKDFDDPFRLNLFTSHDEMRSVLGDYDKDPLYSKIKNLFDRKRNQCRNILK